MATNRARWLADALHLAAVFTTIVACVLLYRPAVDADPYAYLALTASGLALLAVLQMVRRQPDDGAPEKTFVRTLVALGMWSVRSRYHRLLGYVIMTSLVATSWLLGKRSVVYFTVACAQAKTVEIHGLEPRTCTDGESLAVWTVRGDPLSGTVCKWTSPYRSQDAQVADKAIHCRECRVRSHGVCLDRAADFHAAVAAAVKSHANAYELKEDGATASDRSKTLFDSHGRPKSVGRVLVERSPELLVLYDELRSGSPKAKLVFLTGAGGAGKGPVVRELADNDLSPAVGYIDLAWWRDSGYTTSGDPYATLGDQKPALPRLARSVLPLTLPTDRDKAAALFERLFTFQKSGRDPSKFTGAIVDSLDEFDVVTRRNVAGAAKAWAAQGNRMVVLAGRAEGFRGLAGNDMSSSVPTMHVEPMYVGSDSAFKWFLADYACHLKNNAAARPPDCDSVDIRQHWASKVMDQLSRDFWKTAKYLAYATAQANKVAEFVLHHRTLVADNNAADEATGKLATQLLAFAFDRGEQRHQRPRTQEYQAALFELMGSIRPEGPGRLSYDVRTLEIQVDPQAPRMNGYDLLAFSSFVDAFPPALDEVTMTFYPPVLQLVAACRAKSPAAIGRCVRLAFYPDEGEVGLAQRRIAR